MKVEKNKYAAVILAAGLSSRLGMWKPGILINNIPLLFYTVKPLLKVCSRIIIVGGHNYEKLKDLLDENAGIFGEGSGKIMLIKNEGFEKGMFSSVKLGVGEVSKDYKAIFIVPGDMPLIREETCLKIKYAFENSNSEVIIPSVRISAGQEEFSTVKGHPILISMKTAKKILEENDNVSLRDVIRSSLQEIIMVDDEGICIDVDNENDLETVLSYFKEMKKRNE